MTTTRPNGQPNPVTVGEMVGWLAAAWFCSILCGVVLLRGTNDLGSANPISFDRAVLVSINAGTLTGFRHDFVSFEQFGPVIKTMLGIETALGLALATIGGGLGLNRALGRPHGDGAVVGMAAGIALLSVAIGWAGLTANSGLNALSVAAGSNAWFTRTSPSAGGVAGMAIPIALLGALGPVVLLDLIAVVRRRTAIATHARNVFAAIAATFLIGLIAAVACLAFEPASTIPGGAARPENLITSAARALAAPGATRALVDVPAVVAGGVATPAHEAPRALPWVLVALAVIGVGSAGTGGGVGWAWRWTMALPDAARRDVKRAVAVQLGATFAGLLYLLTTQTQVPADRMLLVVVSAAFNVGVTTQPLAAQDDAAFVLSALMLMGRGLPVVLVWWVAWDRQKIVADRSHGD